MEKIEIGKNYQIHCYKHDGKIHCAWEEAIALDETDEYVVFGNNKTLVTEADGRTWRTKEPAIIYFFKDKWYNIIAQLKKDGISYYCNIETPYILEDETIKYIDYDLDLRIYASGEYKILDRQEYKYHKKLMGYSNELDISIKKGLDDLIKLYKEGNQLFSLEQNMKYYDVYKDLKK